MFADEIQQLRRQQVVANEFISTSVRWIVHVDQQATNVSSGFTDRLEQTKC